MFTKRMAKGASLLVLLAGMTVLPALAVNVKKPDWIATLKTEEQKGVLSFKGSQLKDPAKVHVTYQDNLQGGEPVKYESFWYNEQGKPIGQEKFTSYGIRPNETVLIRVEHKDPGKVSQKEYRAAAEASLRFFLDASLHNAHLPGISVPLDSFDEIEQSFEQKNFSKYTPAIDRSEESKNKVLIYLTSYPEGRDQYLMFNGQ